MGLIGIIIGVTVFLELPDREDDLELTQVQNGLRIVNRGNAPITILRVTINDKPECSAEFHETLGIGNFMGVANPDALNLLGLLQKRAPTNCGQIVKVTVATSNGTSEYYFR